MHKISVDKIWKTFGGGGGGGKYVLELESKWRGSGNDERYCLKDRQVLIEEVQEM